MKTLNQTILITGCSTGIGYQTAIILKERGYRVITSARGSKDVSRLQSEGFEAVQLDLADSASIQSAVKQVISLTDGKLDG